VILCDPCRRLIIISDCNEPVRRGAENAKTPARPRSSQRAFFATYCVGNQLSPLGVHGWGEGAGISSPIGFGLGAARFLAAGFFRAAFARPPRVAFRVALRAAGLRRVAFFLAGALRFFAAFLATLSPPLKLDR
jgi:hypothetical protein